MGQIIGVPRSNTGRRYWTYNHSRDGRRPSRQRVSALGARHIVDYHDLDWPEQVRALTAGHRAAAAANAAPGGAASAIRAGADGGRLATITSDPPRRQRGITRLQPLRPGAWKPATPARQAPGRRTA